MCSPHHQPGQPSPPAKGTCVSSSWGEPQPRPFIPPPTEQASGFLGEETPFSSLDGLSLPHCCPDLPELSAWWEGTGADLAASRAAVAASPKAPQRQWGGTAAIIEIWELSDQAGPSVCHCMELLVRSSFRLGQFIFFNGQ